MTVAVSSRGKVADVDDLRESPRLDLDSGLGIPEEDSLGLFVAGENQRTLGRHRRRRRETGPRKQSRPGEILHHRSTLEYLGRVKKSGLRMVRSNETDKERSQEG